MSNRRGETHRAIRRAFGDETTTSDRLLLWLLKFAFEVAIVAVICIISNWRRRHPAHVGHLHPHLSGRGEAGPMRDKLPSDGSNAAREVGTSAQPPTLSSRLASHRAKAEAAPMPRAYADCDDCMGDCDDDESEACIARQRAQTAFDRANDPATVLALLDVVEAAEEMSDYYKHMSDSHSHKLRTALDRLKEVLR